MNAIFKTYGRHASRMQSAPSRNAGLSLIELMIAMTLGLLTIAAVGYVFLGTSKTYRTQDSLARMQEGARYAFEVISNDLRMVGTTGCSYTNAVNVLNNYSTTWYENLLEQPLSSAEKTGAAGLTQYSDALSILRADVSREYVVLSHNTGASQITFTAPHNITAGAFLVATDCIDTAVFQATGVTSNAVSHSAGGTPGNSTANLGSGGAVKTYAAGSRVYQMNAVTYYVALNPSGQPSLFRTRPVGAAATLTPEELIEGVEDFQVAFGVDTSATADGAVDFIDPDGDGDPYLTAAQVNSASVPGANAKERWARVVSARISLLMRTVEDQVSPTAQTYTYNGVTTTPTDRRLRKVFTHVIKLRNR